MIFSFDHLETPGHTCFDDYRYDPNSPEAVLYGMDGGLGKRLLDVALSKTMTIPG